MGIPTKVGRGLGSMGKGLGSLQAYRKDQVSWDDVIKEARLFNYSPKDVSEILNKKFLAEFYKDTSFLTFALCAVYHLRLEKLKKDEKPYAAQSYVMRHYPDLVAEDMGDLNKQLRTAKGHKKKTLTEKQRSKRNSIRNRYVKIQKHQNWNAFLNKFSKAAPIQKILNRYFVR